MGVLDEAELAAALKRPPPRPQVQENGASDSSPVAASRNGETAPEVVRSSLRCPTCNKGRACGLVVNLTKEMGRLQKRGDVFEAQILMNKMRSQGHRASVRTYTTLLATISKSRDPEVRAHFVAYSRNLLT